MRTALIGVALLLAGCNLPAAEVPTPQEEGAKAVYFYDFECYIGTSRTTYVKNMSQPALHHASMDAWELRSDAVNPHQAEDIYYYKQRLGEMCGSRVVELPLAATGGPSSTESTPTAK